ncbi:MAG TPA: FxDxF family PEP-CTERM protein, partial [Methyloradius sp.]
GRTIVSGGTLTLDGANRISASSALELSGGTLEIANVNSANGQTFASLSLTDNSILNLGSTSITFNGLGDVVGGKTLTITDYLASVSPTYAFRVLGNFSSDISFQSLISGTTINGVAAKFQFDGVYTNVAAVPEPEAYAMFIFGLGLIGFVARRRKQEEELA